MCNEVIAPPSRGMEILNVVTAAKVADSYRVTPIDTRIAVDVPIWIVSQWSAEFEADRRVHSGALQLVAPGGERVLDRIEMDLDFRDTIVCRLIHRIPDMRFIGLGTYEFHVLLPGFASLGEW